MRGESFEASSIHLYGLVRQAIPAGASISAPEAAMPALYSGRRVYYFPLGMTQAEYLLVTGIAG